MKKAIFFICFFCFSVFLHADEAQINLEHKNGGDHFEHYGIADMPDAVYYDTDEMEIIIEADGTSLYYNVQIVSNSLNQTVILTQISGYGDTIDVSSLSSGNYTIVITSQFLNEYEGQFTI